MKRRLREWLTSVESVEYRVAQNAFVIGLGRFGSALAETLVEEGVEVMAIDTDADLVNRFADHITQVRRADGTSPEVLHQLGAESFDVAVVCIGSDVEASVLATAALVDLGVEHIWVKAITEQHGRILERVGAHHVVYPEREMGQRVAHAVSGQVFDYFTLDKDFVLADIQAPEWMVGKTLRESNIRPEYKITVVCMKPEGGSFEYVSAETMVRTRDHLLVAGRTEDVDRFVHDASAE